MEDKFVKMQQEIDEAKEVARLAKQTAQLGKQRERKEGLTIWRADKRKRAILAQDVQSIAGQFLGSMSER